MQLPQKFVERMKQMLGEEEYRAYEACLEKRARSALRVNTGKLSVEDWKKISPFTMRQVPWISNGFYYDDTDAPSKHPYYYAGLYYLQEPSAMTPANLLPIAPGDRVLDICAAPGGKSTELAAKLQGTGLLVANDISATRAKALLKNLEVFGATNILVVSEEPSKLAERFPGYFDKILVDAPCSGEGMFRKQPVIMKNWEQYGTEYYNNLQKSILPQAVSMLRPGGMLLYSTCTFSALEDEETISYLLNRCPEMELVSAIPEGASDRYAEYGFMTGRPDWMEEPLPEVGKCVRLFPHRLEGEGHFVALFRKKEDASDTGHTESFRGYCKRSEIPEELRDLLSQIKFLNGRVDENRIVIRDERVYAMPKDMPATNGMRVLRSGWYLGDAKKGRFEPSQAFAMGLASSEYPAVYNMSAEDPRTVRYLKCETLEVTEDMPEGNVLICVDSYPLGFARIKKDSFKNRYLSGWRML
ncbi:MAG: RsmB/NOP family class I SAM-dependent RNA methyltransferase [Lachnospiraceae bacterium]|nr:RsmB/NOP family class I SAM-dependent RNA methyltransferase [Lachnospiraceae bacterium]